MRLAVVGASGWIGSNVVRAASSAGVGVLGLGRARSAPPGLAVSEWRTIPGNASVEDLTAALSGVEAVINTAGRAHQPESDAADFANEELPGRIVQAASASTVARVVHLSSIKAVSEGGRRPLKPSDFARPSTAYGRSKLRGEREARHCARTSAVELLIVRVPVVHGHGASGNLHRLETLIRRRLPVLLPAPYPVRSVADVVNVSSLLIHLASIGHKAPAVVHWADLPHLNTRELVDMIALRVGRRGRVIPFPANVARPALRMLGRERDADRLLAPLIVQPSNPDLLGWAPPFPGHSGFARSGVFV